MSLYTRAQDTTLRLLTQYGQAVTLSRETGDTHDPTTGAVTAGTTETYNTQGIVLEYGSIAQSSGERYANGTLIEINDKKIVIAAKDLGTVPALGDVITADGVNYVVKNVTQSNPAGTPIIYTLQGRP